VLYVRVPCCSGIKDHPEDFDYIIINSLVSSNNKKNSDFLITSVRTFIKILKMRVDKWSNWGTPDGQLNLG